MGKQVLLIGFVLIAFLTQASAHNASVFKADTIVGSKVITNEYAGSAYRKRGKEYFVIINKDTSDFKCFFSEDKEDANIDLDIGDHKLRPEKKTTCATKFEELKIILPVASQEFNIKLLKTIWLGRLVRFGDLAVQITKQYKNRFGENYENIDYKKITPFLMHSKLIDDLNNIFKPYAVTVYNISLEHIFFTTKKDLYWNSKVATDPNEVPERIFDSMIWVELH